MNRTLDVHGLTKRFGPRTAVDDVSFVVDEGEIVSLLGPNGAGKTTMIRLLGGVAKPDAGRAIVVGYSVRESPLEVKRRIGVVTEDCCLYERLTARENLSFFAQLHSLPQDLAKKRIAETLELTDLTGRADETVRGFSKGMKKRLSIARSLLHQPKLLFLDEPNSDLDPIAAKEIRTHIVEIARQQKVTILISSHNLFETETISTRVLIMNRGKLIVDSGLAELLKARGGRLEDIYVSAIEKDSRHRP